MSTLGIILGVLLIALGIWTLLEARFGAGVLRGEVLTACSQFLLGAGILTINLVPSGVVRLSIVGIVVLLGVSIAVVKYRGGRRARNGESERAA